MLNKDLHVHFTGSLPQKYIFEKIIQTLPANNFDNWNVQLFASIPKGDFLNMLEVEQKYYFDIFCQNLKNYFKPNDPKLNLQKFFSLYEIIQKAVKSQTGFDDYYEGSYQLTKQMILDNTNCFEIITGATKNKSATIEKITKVVAGIQNAERNLRTRCKAQVRITFIRDGHRVLKNYSPIILNDIFSIIEESANSQHYISGFDFSGEENPMDIDTLIDAIKEIQLFNFHRKTKGKKIFKISVHAGENFFDFSNDVYLNFFSKLSNAPIDLIGHGTFLWIPKKLIKLDTYEDVERRKILNQFIHNKVTFEICPTANVLLTPLGGYENIPFNFFDKINLSYYLNSDNKTIFSTNITNEYANCKKG